MVQSPITGINELQYNLKSIKLKGKGKGQQHTISLLLSNQKVFFYTDVTDVNKLSGFVNDGGYLTFSFQVRHYCIIQLVSTMLGIVLLHVFVCLLCEDRTVTQSR